MSEQQQWHYIDTAGQQIGPIPGDQLHSYVSAGHITAETQIWTDGMAEWLPASSIEGLIPAVAAPQQQIQANPYAPPQTQVTAQAASGDYPVPNVKRCSFGLYLILSLLGIGIIVGGYVKMIANLQSVTTPDELEASSSSAFVLIGVGGLFFLGALIYRLIIVYRSWLILQPGNPTSTPGKAVGFLFIPFFNLYWMFIAYWKWSVDYTRITSQYPGLQAAPKVSSGLFLTGCILFIVSNVPIISIFAAPVSLIIELIMAKQTCNAVNFMASLRVTPLSNSQQTSSPGGIVLR